VVRSACGNAIANEAARYLFHERLRSFATPQNPSPVEPLGSTVPSVVRKAIRAMEQNLESQVAIPRICDDIGISQRQLIRLFRRYVKQSPVHYYRDIRLDRARGLVTQTDRLLSEVGVASGFPNQAHFSRAYRRRFGLTPRADRIAGRIPFEFRAWPMHHPHTDAPQSRRPARLAKKVKTKSK
jgi:AraC family carnitine catabolism transcriptional activator